MEKQLERVAEMIKISLPKTQHACFDGCVLYMNERCIGIRDACNKGLELRFKSIDEKLDRIISIVGGNGYGGR